MNVKDYLCSEREKLWKTQKEIMLYNEDKE